VDVGTDSVTVVSERTGNRRTIPYRDLRQAEAVRTNGVIVRVLAQILGLYDGEASGLDAEQEN
jgi:hypothetical protein